MEDFDELADNTSNVKHQLNHPTKVSSGGLMANRQKLISLPKALENIAVDSSNKAKPTRNPGYERSHRMSSDN